MTTGVYGEDYYPTQAPAVIEVEYSESLALPESMKTAIGSIGAAQRGDTEFVIVFHEAPRFHECEKFLCTNRDEFNIMYHGWAYPTYSMADNNEESNAVLKTLVSGAFDVTGVQGVHLNLQDSGLTIDKLNEYTIIIHDMSFSPENLMLQVDHAYDLCSFFCFACLPESGRSIASLHVLPVTDAANYQLKTCAETSTTFGELLSSLDALAVSGASQASSKLRNLIQSIPS